MRWKSRKPREEGTTRIVSAFLFFPKEIDDIWRWLEVATWKEEWYTGEGELDVYVWLPIKWLDIREDNV